MVKLRPSTRRRAVFLAFLSFAAAVLPASGATQPPELLHTSVDTGWANPTEHVRSDQTVFDPSDPPGQKADGRVTTLVSRWGQQLCVPGEPLPSSIVVRDKDEQIVPGTLSFEWYEGRPDRVMRFTFDQPITSARAPFVATFTGVRRRLGADGSAQCLESETTIGTRRFGVDRFIPHSPTFTAPALTTVAVEGSNARADLLVREEDDVVVEGIARDRLTWPDEDRIETSGISSVVVTLYRVSGSTRPRTRRVRAWGFRNECDEQITDESPTADLPGCPLELAFSQVIPRNLLRAGTRYVIGARCLDRAGDTNVPGTETASGETRTPPWMYVG